MHSNVPNALDMQFLLDAQGAFVRNYGTKPIQCMAIPQRATNLRLYPWHISTRRRKQPSVGVRGRLSRIGLPRIARRLCRMSIGRRDIVKYKYIRARRSGVRFSTKDCLLLPLTCAMGRNVLRLLMVGLVCWHSENRK